MLLLEKHLQKAARAAKWAAGLCIGHYVLQLGFGLVTGQELFDATYSPLLRLNALIFLGYYLAQGLAIYQVNSSLRFIRPVTAGFGQAFGQVSMVLGGIGLLAALVSLVGNKQLLDTLMPICGPGGILTAFVGAIIGGILLWQTRLLDRATALGLLVFGALTAPLGMVLAGILDGVLPVYYYSELHFVGVGLLWLWISRRLVNSTRSVKKSPAVVFS